MEKAVIDRIVDGKVAVLLVGENEEEVTVHAGELPEGAEEGTHVLVELRDGIIEGITTDEEATSSVKERIHSKMERLRKKKRSN